MASGLAIAGAVGVGVEAGGQIYGGIKARKASKEKQKQLDEQARLEQEAAEFEALQATRKFDNLLGTQKARIGGSGIKLEGSPLLLLEETLRDKKETVDNIRKFGAARAEALKAQAGNARDMGRDMLTSSIFQGLGTIGKAVAKAKSKSSGGASQIGGAA